MRQPETPSSRQTTRPLPDSTEDESENIEAPEMFSTASRLPSWSLERILFAGGVFCAGGILAQSLVSQKSTWLLLALVWCCQGAILLLTTPFARNKWRQLRIRMAPAPIGPVLAYVRTEWQAQDQLARDVASAEELQLFEQEYGVRLPDDMRLYFSLVNGTSAPALLFDEDNAFTFWPLNAVQPFAELGLSDADDAGRVFAFASFFTNYGIYGVRLSADPALPTPVMIRLPYAQFQIAEGFVEFMAAYAMRDRSVLLPEHSVLADGHGLGVEFNGEVSYTLAWDQVQRIAVEIVVDEEGSDATSRWRIWDDVEERFTAPVDTIPGGNLVRAGIRALPGFQSQAYQAAIDAEAERVAASFIVWRGTGSRPGHVGSTLPLPPTNAPPS